MKILVEVKNVYGNEVVYPVCEKARLFADIAGNRTLTAKTLKAVSKLGYAIEELHTPHIHVTGLIMEKIQRGDIV